MADTAPRTEHQDFDPGHALPRFVRKAGLEAWNRYAAVNDEFVALHMDDAAGQAAGYPGAIGMGNLIHAWLHALIEDWLDGRGRLALLECRFRAPALKDDEVTSTGVVRQRTPRADGSTELGLELWADRHTGDRLVTARAVVLIPA